MLSPLFQAGALQNSQSPVDTEGAVMGPARNPSRSPRWSILLTFEKLINSERARDGASLSEDLGDADLN